MRRSTKTLIGAAAALTVAVGIGGAAVAASGESDPPAERNAETAYTDAHRADARITQSEAEQRALAVRPGTVVESHLETEGHGLRWEVKTDDGTRVWEVQLDPTTGAVVSNQGGE